MGLSSLVISVIADTIGLRAGLDTTATALTTFDNKLAGVGGSFGSGMANSARGLSAVMTDLAFRAGKYVVTLAADAEGMELAFTAMLRDAGKAQSLLSDMRDFAIATPFTSKEVIQGGKQLLAYGFTASEIIPAMKALGDVSSALQVDMTDLVYVFGTTRTQGKVMTRDLMQFSQRGIPIIEELGRVLNISADEVLKFTEDGKINFGHIQQAFNNMTQGGGLFANMMDKQSKTLSGKWSTLVDTVELSATGIGKNVIESFRLKDVVDNLIVVAESLGKAFNKTLIFLKPVFTLIMGVGNLLIMPFKLLWAVLETISDVMGQLAGREIKGVGDSLEEIGNTLMNVGGSFKQMKAFALDSIENIRIGWSYLEDAFVFFDKVLIGSTVAAFVYLYQQVVNAIKGIVEAIDSVTPGEGFAKDIKALEREVKQAEKTVADFANRANSFEFGRGVKDIKEQYAGVRNALVEVNKEAKDFSGAMKLQAESMKELREFATGVNKELETPWEKFSEKTRMLSNVTGKGDTEEFVASYTKAFTKWRDSIDAMGLFHFNVDVDKDSLHEFEASKDIFISGGGKPGLKFAQEYFKAFESYLETYDSTTKQKFHIPLDAMDLQGLADELDVKRGQVKEIFTIPFIEAKKKYDDLKSVFGQGIPGFVGPPRSGGTIEERIEQLKRQGMTVDEAMKQMQWPVDKATARFDKFDSGKYDKSFIGTKDRQNLAFMKFFNELKSSSGIDTKIELPKMVTAGSVDEVSLINQYNASGGKMDFETLAERVLKAIADKQREDSANAAALKKAFDKVAEQLGDTINIP